MKALKHPVAPVLLGLFVLALAAVGCGGSAAGPPVVLHLETTDLVGPQHNVGLQRFAARVSELSHGNLRVRIGIDRSPSDPDQTGDHEPVDDWTLARQVARGQVDLALVRTQAFDTLGVHSFDALDAPMLIDSDAAQAAVLRSDVPASMLGGTAHAGVSGLAVLGGGLSRPVSMKRPLVRPADFEGLTWRDVPSTGRDAAVRAVAGRLDRVLHPWFMLPIGLKSGSIGVLESSLDALFFDLVPQTPTAYVTDGVRLWPNMSALIANPHRLARLSATQRAWLRQAAMEAQAYSVANAKSDRAAVADLCATGVRFVEAPAGTAAALRRAFSSAYSKLDRDAETRRYIERIQQLRSALPPEQPLRVPPACSVHHPAPVGAGPAVASSVPDGVYRTRLSAGDLRRAHITGLDVARYAGTETLTIARGRWRLDQEGSFGRSRASGTYSGTPLRTVWTVLKENGAPARPLDQSRYSLSYGNGVLRVIARPSDLESALYSSHPWERIG